MSDQKRPYRKKRRAELEAETRKRITESAVHLHGTLGPARTSVSAVAEHAGVRRSTVYRHFPDEAALFTACSSHWSAANPSPDPGGWAGIEDPAERLGLALAELYGYYRRSEGMMENILRDEPTMPVVAQAMGPFREYLESVRDVLLKGRAARGRERKRVRAALGHAIAFSTWRSLAREQGLEDDDAVKLISAMVDPPC